MSIKQILASFRRERSFEWGRIIAFTGSSQAFIHGLGFLSGILIIRLLPTEEYALYTLASVMFSNLNILADSGIKSSVMAQGGGVWQERDKLGEVVATGFFLRRKFATISFIVACPIMLILLRHHGASWWVALSIVVSIIPAFYASLTGSLLEVVPKLQQQIFQLQKIQIKASLVRLVILLSTLFYLPLTAIAMIASGVSQIWANKGLRQLAYSFIDATKGPNPQVRLEIMRMVRRLLPESIYLVISGHITVWLISIFGDTTAVAQIGALGRLAMVLSVFTVLFGTLIAPRFSRFKNNKDLLYTRYWQIQISLVVLCAGVVFGSWVFATEMLWLLGNGYSGLEGEIILMMTGNCLGFIAVSTFYLCRTRGWVINPFISIPVSMSGITAGAFLFEISTLPGVFVFNIFNNSVILILHVGYGFYRIHKLQKDTNSEQIFER